MAPVNIGERSVAPRMISCVRAFVAVMWQWTCGRVILAAAEEGEHGPRLVARLRPHGGVVERAAVEARRRAGLEAPDRERHLAQARGQRVRGRIADTPSLRAFEADVDAPAEEGADGQHDGARDDRRAVHRDDALGARRS